LMPRQGHAHAEVPKFAAALAIQYRRELARRQLPERRRLNADGGGLR
jgi:hypothetical protein